MIELRDVEFKVDSPNGELEIIDKINLKIGKRKVYCYNRSERRRQVNACKSLLWELRSRQAEKFF